jgi:hypothetical protein
MQFDHITSDTSHGPSLDPAFEPDLDERCFFELWFVVQCGV